MEVIAIVGKICSGKDTFAQNLALHTHIDIGSIVRELMNKEERVHNKDLDKNIIIELRKHLVDSDKFVITGIRQLSILKALFVFYQNIEIVWLEVPDLELKRRYLSRDNRKEDTSFEEALENDRELGLEILEMYIKSLPQTKIINNY